MCKFKNSFCYELKQAYLILLHLNFLGVSDTAFYKTLQEYYDLLMAQMMTSIL